MLCATHFARRHAGRQDLAAAPSRSTRRRRPQVPASILRCDEFSHGAWAARFTSTGSGATRLPRGCWRAAENIAWGSGSTRRRAVDLRRLDALAGVTAQTSTRPFRRDRHRPARKRHARGDARVHVWTQDFGSHKLTGAHAVASLDVPGIVGSK